jgi:hypothetical protein
MKSKEANDLLNTILGDLHNIEHYAHCIEQWHNDPNLNVPKYAKRIRELRIEAHEASVKLRDFIKENA